jgi:hypothetical protein
MWNALVLLFRLPISIAWFVLLTIVWAPVLTSVSVLLLLWGMLTMPFVVAKEIVANNPDGVSSYDPSQQWKSCRGQVEVLASHPSKCTMGGAASVVAVSTESRERWAGPPDGRGRPSLHWRGRPSLHERRLQVTLRACDFFRAFGCRAEL